MKKTSIIILVISLFWGSCNSSETIELELTYHKGYGKLSPSYSGLSPYDNNPNNPWKGICLEPKGVPQNWTDVKLGDITLDYKQVVYQNYKAGKISEEWFKNVKSGWSWEPDSTKLSKKPIKVQVAFAVGKDAEGKKKLVVDANNNLDLSDDRIIELHKMCSGTHAQSDSTAIANSIEITYEKLVNGKVETAKAPVYIVKGYHADRLMMNYPQYATAEFEGQKIVVSTGFTELNNTNVKIILDDENHRPDYKSMLNLVKHNEYIELSGKLYKNLGLNSKSGKLMLEKCKETKENLYSTQFGFKPHPFKGKVVNKEESISLEKLKGKYVLIDFWTVFCGPCIGEFPHLRELYKRADKSKFEIVGIVSRSPLDRLNNIMEKDSVSWPQIYSDEGNDIVKQYGVTSFPTSYLIDPEGKIVEKNLRGRNLNKVLEYLEKMN
jgi:thiol-disulfide isomerase/thioredoxin